MIFVDTSFWVALINRRDSHHAAATTLLDLHSYERLLTTNEVRGETWTLLRRRASHHIAVRFLDALETSPRVKLVRVSEPTETEASNWLRRSYDQELSWVHATSFATMLELRITEALAFDGRFATAGFTEIRT